MMIAAAPFIIIDTETTGIDPEKDRIVEIAAREYCSATREFDTLVNPRIPIPPQSSAIHHLTDTDVLEAPWFEIAWDMLRYNVLRSLRDPIFVAHHAIFDRSFLPGVANSRWLCTERLAHHLVPEAPAFNLQTLRYFLGGEHLDLRGISPHRALADVIVCEFVLSALLERYFQRGGVDDVAVLLAFAEMPYLVTTMPFGKYRGMPVAELDADYLRWGIRNLRDATDLVYTFDHELKRRFASEGATT